MKTLILTLLFTLALNACIKEPCFTEIRVPVTMLCKNTSNLKTISINFYQGSRPVGADIVNSSNFIQDTAKYVYKFKDTDPDFITFKTYTLDGGWVEYGTHIFADTTLTNSTQENGVLIHFEVSKQEWLNCKQLEIQNFHGMEKQ